MQQIMRDTVANGNTRATPDTSGREQAHRSYRHRGRRNRQTPEEAIAVIADAQRPISERMEEITATIEEAVFHRKRDSQAEGSSRGGPRQSPRAVAVPGVNSRITTQTHHHQLLRAGSTSWRNRDATASMASLESKHKKEAAISPTNTTKQEAPNKSTMSRACDDDNSSTQGSSTGALPFSEDTTVNLNDGRKVRVRGIKHTWKDIARGETTLVNCPGCRAVLQVGAKAKLLYCTQCGEVSPIESPKHDKEGSSKVTSRSGGQRAGAQHVPCLTAGDGQIAQVVQQQEMDVAIARKLARNNAAAVTAK
eukprot:CAMPEP_0116852432 /NCGR_PEP_ID=MMETSP0418-20121206/17287_1 /TAXON_ID=1158023 /ORGANISM="Astrosyne radiata, Strain 13vi08-1A" /LENGTH=307 /DNA_ID=CAMNT_0004484589 /DNA_START=193 /DNA_END=1116 /DNA_ORIENTATION=-